MMKLPNGVTGFFDAEMNMPPQMDMKEYKKVCFQIVTHNGGRILNFSFAAYPKSYYQVHIELFGRRFFLLLHKHYPIAAFVSEMTVDGMIFIDLPLVAELFSPIYHVCTTNELHAPLPKEHNLNQVELKQITYWRPNTIGEIIFNEWD